MTMAYEYDAAWTLLCLSFIRHVRSSFLLRIYHRSRRAQSGKLYASERRCLGIKTLALKSMRDGFVVTGGAKRYRDDHAALLPDVNT